MLAKFHGNKHNLSENTAKSFVGYTVQKCAFSRVLHWVRYFNEISYPGTSHWVLTGLPKAICYHNSTLNGTEHTKASCMLNRWLIQVPFSHLGRTKFFQPNDDSIQYAVINNMKTL